ncbi:hypothetical protein Tco_1171852, partial [Tanacetum coccineum]
VGVVILGKESVVVMKTMEIVVMLVGKKGIWGGDEDHGDSGDAGGEDIASSLATSESYHAGIGTNL